MICTQCGSEVCGAFCRSCGHELPDAAEPEPPAAEIKPAEPEAAEPETPDPPSAAPSAAGPSAAGPSAVEPSAVEPSAVEPSGAHDVPKAPRARRRPPKLAAASVILLALGLTAVGAWSGHRWWPREAVEVPAAAASLPPASATTGTVMPDVLGLSEAIARRALTDAGLAGTVTTVKRPSAGQPGTVVDQAPAPGAGPAAVTLTVADPAVVGNVIGQRHGDARTQFEQLGAVVTVNHVVVPTAPVGTVVAVRPAVGQPLPASVEIDVADAGTPLALTELRQVSESGCSSGSKLRIGTEQVEKAITCRSRTGNPPQLAYVDYDLAGKVDALKMTLGVDNAGEQGVATVVVTGDGKELSRATLTFGKPTPVTIGVGRVIRLRVSVLTPGERPATAVLGDPTLLGTAENIKGLKS